MHQPQPGPDATTYVRHKPAAIIGVEDFSPHARRRLAALLRLELLELRKEHLERIERVVEGQASVQSLLVDDRGQGPETTCSVKVAPKQSQAHL